MVILHYSYVSLPEGTVEHPRWLQMTPGFSHIKTHMAMD